MWEQEQELAGVPEAQEWVSAEVWDAVWAWAAEQAVAEALVAEDVGEAAHEA
jgi:hypothetical protein